MYVNERHSLNRPFLFQQQVIPAIVHGLFPVAVHTQFHFHMFQLFLLHPPWYELSVHQVYCSGSPNSGCRCADLEIQM